MASAAPLAASRANVERALAEELGFAIATIADARNGYLSGIDVLIDGGASTGKKS